MTKRPRLQELDTNIKAALQADPELLEFYMNLTNKQKEDSYISLDSNNLSPESIRFIINLIKDVEEGNCERGIKLNFSNIKTKEDLDKEIEKAIKIGNQK